MARCIIIDVCVRATNIAVGWKHDAVNIVCGHPVLKVAFAGRLQGTEGGGEIWVIVGRVLETAGGVSEVVDQSVPVDGIGRLRVANLDVSGWQGGEDSGR